MKISIRNFLIEKADEFQNDFLTPERFGEHHGLTLAQAESFLKLAQSIRASNHPDYN